MNDKYFSPRDYEAHPPTQIAADGKTVLYRYDVHAVVYAPDAVYAMGKLEGANIYLEAADIPSRNDEMLFVLRHDEVATIAGALAPSNERINVQGIFGPWPELHKTFPPLAFWEYVEGHEEFYDADFGY